MAELEQLKTDFKTSEKGKNFQSAIQDAVESEVRESRKIDRRKNNIMMYDIEERESEEDDSEADHIKVKSILKDQLNLPNVKIAKVFRVGRRQELTPAPRKRFRPIKVIFSNEGDKLMKNYWAKKDKKVDLQFGISNDHTRFESRQYTKLKEKLNELKIKGCRTGVLEGFN